MWGCGRERVGSKPSPAALKLSPWQPNCSNNSLRSLAPLPELKASPDVQAGRGGLLLCPVYI